MLLILLPVHLVYWTGVVAGLAPALAGKGSKRWRILLPEQACTRQAGHAASETKTGHALRPGPFDDK